MGCPFYMVFQRTTAEDDNFKVKIYRLEHNHELDGSMLTCETGRGKKDTSGGINGVF